MNDKTSIVIIGPLPEPITGVSLANKVVKNALLENGRYSVEVVNTSYPYFEEDLGSLSFKKVLFFLKLNLCCWRIRKFDCIYMTPGQTFLGVLKYMPFILLGKLWGKELIMHLHGNYLGTFFEELKGAKKKILYTLISKFSKGIVLSDSLKGNLTPFLSKDKIYVLSNFAEDYLYEDMVSSKERMVQNKLHIVFLSNLMKEKGILVFLEALKCLENKGLSYEAKIAGTMDSALEQEIFSKINNLKNTEYIGVVSGNRKKDLLNWSNVFVLPTFYKMEGQPISILEALATKNVIVTTRHAGIPDIINENEQGYFVEKKSVKSLSDRLEWLSNSLDVVGEIGHRNHVYFRNNFTVNQFKQGLLRILNA